MWYFTGSELGDEPIDASMPKQRGEVLVNGSAYPSGGPRPVCAPRVAIGTVDLMEGSLQKATLHGADLGGANLFRVDFARSRADAATNLEGANVKHVRVVPPRKRSPGPAGGAAPPDVPPRGPPSVVR